MTIYIDADYKAYVSPAGGRTEHEDSFFDNKCINLIESYRYVPVGETWTREDGEEFVGLMVAPWRKLDDAMNAQVAYLSTKIGDAQDTIAELDAALLDAEYKNIIGEDINE